MRGIQWTAFKRCEKDGLLTLFDEIQKYILNGEISYLLFMRARLILHLKIFTVISSFQVEKIYVVYLLCCDHSGIAFSSFSRVMSYWYYLVFIREIYVTPRKSASVIQFISVNIHSSMLVLQHRVSCISVLNLMWC